MNFPELLQSYNRALEAGIKCGREVTEDRFHRQIRALESAYQKASLDPETKIPSYLMAVIASIIGTLPEVYAETMIKRDKEVQQWEREARTGGKDTAVGS